MNSAGGADVHKSQVPLRGRGPTFLIWPAGSTAQTLLSAAATSQVIESCAVHAKAKGQVTLLRSTTPEGIPARRGA